MLFRLSYFCSIKEAEQKAKDSPKVIQTCLLDILASSALKFDIERLLSHKENPGTVSGSMTLRGAWVYIFDDSCQNDECHKVSTYIRIDTSPIN